MRIPVIPRLLRQLLALFLLLLPLLGHAAKQGDWLTENGQRHYLGFRQMGERLLADYPDANPLATEQARELVAGRTGKAWKNCILRDTLQRQLTPNDPR